MDDDSDVNRNNDGSFDGFDVDMSNDIMSS
jgi:hypothetical protein